MISKHSAHSTLLPIGFRTWLWRYTCLLLLISMLWHRQAIFESKGDKLSSSAEGRIRTHGLTYIHTYVRTYVRTYVHTYIHTYIVGGFNSDALAHGNAYKPTKEPINYRGPGGDRTHDPQTEETPPAGSCPARTLHATEIASNKTQLQWHARGCTGQLTTRLECTGVNFNSCVC